MWTPLCHSIIVHVRSFKLLCASNGACVMVFVETGVSESRYCTVHPRLSSCAGHSQACHCSLMAECYHGCEYDTSLHLFQEGLAATSRLLLPLGMPHTAHLQG